MTTVQRPRLRVRPAVIAPCWPKLRLRRRIRTRRSPRASSCITSHAPSVLRSSTSTISKAGEIGSSAATSRSCKRAQATRAAVDRDDDAQLRGLVH